MADLNIPNVNKKTDKYIFKKKLPLRRKSKRTLFTESAFMFFLGFALVYDKDLMEIKKLDDRSLDIFHKSLKRKSIVKITNPKNGNFLIANVKSNKVRFSNFTFISYALD